LNIIPAERAVRQTATTRLHGLNALRGVAATAVVLHHVIWLLQLKITPFMTPASGYFGLGVPLFFMISAMAMFHVYEGKMHLPSAERAFLIKRYFRLLPLMIVVYFAYNGALQFLYGAWFGGFSITAAVVNISLLFALVPNLSGGPTQAAWSIGIEMLFYLMLPLALRIFITLRTTIIVLLLS
jgi:peptidoglycan/LPS O-acetylase OafA/YrhL